MLDKYGVFKPQRSVLPRPTEQVLQQRVGAVHDHTSTAATWTDWLNETGDHGIHVTVQFLDQLKPAVLERGPRSWWLELTMSVADYAELTPGPEVTLRFVETIEEVLARCGPKLTPPPPDRVGRTKRETAWLADGGTNPGPGTATPLRIRKPPPPMPEARLWDLISRTTSPTTGVFRLGWQQADRFTARMRLLVDALDDEAHRSAAAEVLGFVSDDVWEDTRAWAVSLGPDAYGAILREPTTLAERLRECQSDDEIGEAGALLEFSGTD